MSYGFCDVLRDAEGMRTGCSIAAAQEEIIRDFRSSKNNYYCRRYFQDLRLPPELCGLLWIVFISLIILNRGQGKGVPLERLISRAFLEDLLINLWSPARASILKIGACSGPLIMVVVKELPKEIIRDRSSPKRNYKGFQEFQEQLLLQKLFSRFTTAPQIVRIIVNRFYKAYNHTHKHTNTRPHNFSL